MQEGSKGMLDSAVRIGRWGLVIPASLAAAIISHWVVFTVASLEAGGGLAEAERFTSGNIVARLLAGTAQGYAAVEVGALVAPHAREGVARGLCTLWVFFSGASFLNILTASHEFMGVFTVVASVGGAMAASGLMQPR